MKPNKKKINLDRLKVHEQDTCFSIRDFPKETIQAKKEKK